MLKWLVTTFLSAACVAVSSLPAWAIPTAFKAIGEAQTWDQARAASKPVANTLYYQGGRIRLEMAAPVSAEGVAPFNVVLASEGGRTVILLNPADKQAMKMEMASLDEMAENRSLQQLSQFRLRDFSTTFKARSRAIGSETIAGEPCTIREQHDKSGHVRIWVSERLAIPFKFVYLEKSKPMFAWTVKQFTPSSNLPASAFNVPGGYETVDLTEMMKGLDDAHPQPKR
ncbi:MAG: DUF4412 domain-containing protein [Candidatus Sericytochromatia bacterium]|nr:DUF4412 domain-containing protein [Candidatus Sericytochromatia bacterium]